MVVLTGHPEHDILFIATQVARAAGLKNPSNAVWKYRNAFPDSGAILMGDVSPEGGGKPLDPAGRTYQVSTALMRESDVYQMLLRGHAPASDPFHKWVTEVVLPSIRKTGKFDVNEADDYGC